MLGIDPGTRLCGYAVVETGGQKARYIECGVIQLSATDSLSERLKQLAEELREVIRELHPQEMALESIFHGKNAQSALRLGYARGVVMLLGAEAGLALAEYPPATVKRAVAGHGKASKEEVQRMVRWLCGLKMTPRTDAADALAVALCHGHHLGVPAVLRQAQKGRGQGQGRTR